MIITTNDSELMDYSEQSQPPVAEQEVELSSSCGMNRHSPPRYAMINAENNGTCRTIKAQYQQTSYANFLRSGTFGATGVMVITDE